MHSQSELLRRISNHLDAGVSLARFMLFVSDDPKFFFFSHRLRLARCWVDRLQMEPEPQGTEKAPDIVGLLRDCAEMIKDAGFESLAADFEHLADE